MKQESVEVDFKVNGGQELLIPKAVLDRLSLERGSRVHVRLTSSRVSRALKARSVTEEEIETIAALQLEPRENVVKFLTTESIFATNRRFRRRVQEQRSRR